jgi:hypothetical protein
MKINIKQTSITKFKRKRYLDVIYITQNILYQKVRCGVVVTLLLDSAARDRILPTPSFKFSSHFSATS